MNINTVRVGFGLRPGDPFWVQVRESVQQRAQELDMTLVPVMLPDFCALTIPSLAQSRN